MDYSALFIRSTLSRSATKWIIAILNKNLHYHEMVSIMILVTHICVNIIFSALANDDFIAINNIYKENLVITTLLWCIWYEYFNAKNLCKH